MGLRTHFAVEIVRSRRVAAKNWANGDTPAYPLPQPADNVGVGQMAYAVAIAFRASRAADVSTRPSLGTCPSGAVGHAPVGQSDQTEAVLVIDAANVVGSRPATRWWRDRAGAARAFVDEISSAVATGRLAPPVVVVLEGAARAGVPSGEAGHVTIVHAEGNGDDALVDVVAHASESQPPTLVTADRGLRRRAEAEGAVVVGPAWLLERLP